MKKIFKSVRAKLFLTLCIVIFMIIAFLVIINSAVLESFYYYSKKNVTLDTYEFINEHIENINTNNLKFDIEKIATENNFEIVIKNENELILTTNKDFSSDFGNIPEVKYDIKYNVFRQDEIMYSNQNISIRKIQDKKNGVDFILLLGILDNGNKLYIRTPMTSISESVNISNKFLYVIALLDIIIGGVAITWITERFTKPIVELNDIANEMANLNFTKKYKNNYSSDEIDELRKKY